jgi:hypothetical protein
MRHTPILTRTLSRSVKGKSAARRERALGPGGYAEPDTATRRLVLQRDGYACVCCGVPFLGKPYSVQQRKHTSQGGANNPSNLIMVLGTCAERIRSHRDLRDEESGYSLHADQDPELVPILLYRRIGVWLAPDGFYRCEPPIEVQSSEGTQPWPVQPSHPTFSANSSTTPRPAAFLKATVAAASWLLTGARDARSTGSGRRITLPSFAGSVKRSMKKHVQGLSRFLAPGTGERVANGRGALMISGVNVIVGVLLQRRGDRRLRDLLRLGHFLQRPETCGVQFGGPGLTGREGADGPDEAGGGDRHRAQEGGDVPNQPQDDFCDGVDADEGGNADESAQVLGAAGLPAGTPLPSASGHQFVLRFSRARIRQSLNLWACQAPRRRVSFVPRHRQQRRLRRRFGSLPAIRAGRLPPIRPPGLRRPHSRKA